MGRELAHDRLQELFELIANVMEWMRWAGGSYPLDYFDH